MKDWGVEKFREVFYRDYFPHAAAAAEGRADHRPRPAPRLAAAWATGSGSSA